MDDSNCSNCPDWGFDPFSEPQQIAAMADKEKCRASRMLSHILMYRNFWALIRQKFIFVNLRSIHRAGPATCGRRSILTWVMRPEKGIESWFDEFQFVH